MKGFHTSRKIILISFSLMSFSLSTAWSSRLPTQDIPKMEFDNSTLEGRLLKIFKSAQSEDDVKLARSLALQHGGASISALIRVMKDSRFPDNSRWSATFLLTQIAGKKSAPVLKQFLNHPNWLMKVASLKALLALGATEYGQEYARLLEDQSLLVRAQALENIRHLRLKDYAPNVWAMLYDEENYNQVEGRYRRGDLIRTVILTIGDLEFNEAKEPLLRMVQQDRYNDIFREMNYSLEKITGRNPPSQGEKQIVRRFWQRVAVSFANI